ncbi:MAG: hypothetical protein AAF620_00085 [Bacteroidota bacterium]
MRKIQKMGQVKQAEQRAYYEQHPEEKPLNGDQEQFCHLYVFDPQLMGKKADCYAVVYSKGEKTEKTYTRANEMVKRPNVKAYIKELQQDRLDAYEHIRFSNIETLIKVRDEMANIITRKDQEVDEEGRVKEGTGTAVATHQQRMASIRAVEVLNKMLGYNKPAEAKVTHEAGRGFQFNIVVPGQEPLDITPDAEDVEFEEENDE